MKPWAKFFKKLPVNHKYWINIVIPICFFIVYFIIGLLAFDDYGVSWDEPIQRELGVMTMKYMQGDETLLTHRDRYHGSVIELGLLSMEKILNLKDTRSVFLMRHFVSFCLFYLGTIYFYFLCLRQFKSKKIALIGCLLLIISPRIFAHSFYNTKDIPFLVFFIISIYYLLKFFENEKISTLMAFALTSAILVDIRILGFIVPVLGVFFSSIKLKSKKKVFAYILVFIVFTIIFWPVLWNGPIFHLIAAFKQMKQYPWTANVLYAGEFIESTNLPWHYLFTWIAITVPPVYLLLFILGFLKYIISFCLNPKLVIKNIGATIFFLWLIMPVIAILVLRSVLYDAWRHLFFIYPAIIYFSLAGLVFIYEKAVLIKLPQGFEIRLRENSAKKVFLGLFLYLVLSLVIVYNIFIIVDMHPLQNVYFNKLAGSEKTIRDRFELDYWGLSYRKGLEYILKNDSRKEIYIVAANFPAMANKLILNQRDSERLVFVKDIKQADYFLTNYRWHPKEYKAKIYYRLFVNNLNVMSIYKM